MALHHWAQLRVLRYARAEVLHLLPAEGVGGLAVEIVLVNRDRLYEDIDKIQNPPSFCPSVPLFLPQRQHAVCVCVYLLLRSSTVLSMYSVLLSTFQFVCFSLLLLTD
eukprot:NODE_5328_length_690_cov_25.304212_g4954_i0.p1 GENE.NODE_5328_length_690_cov_25.304212_g4954_i0~~NODE_5328_length_690_cov_25.304212_g4954_i0.p1  ORF type:complete len:108 (-),score=3.02 NODE_5328_length_690_cov_25.304212_g4954_i0:137-460(-)